MAHWAELDDNNVVIRVTVGDNNDQRGDEGYQWLIDNLGGRWVKTSYNGNIRRRFAGIGYTFDEQRNAFISPQPYPSWTLNENTTEWEPPTRLPQGGGRYQWDEATLAWIPLVTEPAP